MAGSEQTWARGGGGGGATRDPCSQRYTHAQRENSPNAPSSSRIPGGAATAPSPRPRLSRFLVRHVPGDHFVHGLARVPNPFLADREIDGGHAFGSRDALNFFAGHVAHEPGRDAVEPCRRVLGPREAGAAVARG